MHHTRDLIVNFVEASAATKLARALPSRSQNEYEVLIVNFEF